MKIAIDNSGQTCNKFWSYLAPLDYSLRTGKKVYILFPDAELGSYPNLRKNRYLKVVHIRWLSKFIPYRTQEKILRRIFSNRFYNILPLLKSTFKNSIWNIYDDRDILISNEAKKLAIELLSPCDKIKNNIRQRFAKEKKDITIGVHIRRGDYATWRNGDYFYSQEQYHNICENLKKEFPDKQIRFFLSSNEKIDKTIFHSDEYFSLSQSAPPEDLYALSLCDYIIGPPSTFSRWAAFYGDKPIRFIMPNESLTKAFRRLVSLERYDTGEPVSMVKDGKLFFF